MKACLAVVMAVWVWASAPWVDAQPQPTGAATIDYQRQVHTILAAQCLGCHSAERRSGGLSLASYADALEGGRSGAAIRPGNAAGSLLVGRITGQVPPSMPLGKPALSAGDVATIRLWIDEGARATPASAAAAPKWEAPLALERPAIPDVVRPGWTTPVDRFTAAYLAGTGGPPPELVGDAAFARRAFLDIWGLLPPPDDLPAFVADANADKRRVLIERLLADNDAYAQHWISFWNDVLRNDEGVNYHSETSSRKSISAWLLSALNKNVPYNRFVEQLLNPGGAGRSRRVPGRRQLARRGEREPDARDAGRAEQRAGLSRDQPQVQLVPRQLHQQMEVEGRVRAWPASSLKRDGSVCTGAMWHRTHTPHPRSCFPS